GKPRDPRARSWVRLASFDNRPASPARMGPPWARQRTSRVLEEPAAQRRDGVVDALGLTGRRVPDGVRQPRRLGAVDPVELPGDPRGLLDQELLEIIARTEVASPG